MNTDDRTLLERAARAAGIGVTWVPEHECFWIDLGQGIAIDIWDPREDHLQAFYLAAKLRLSIIHETQRVAGEAIEIVEVIGQDLGEGKRHCEMHSLDDDSVATICRCITRAAAQIGATKEAS